MKTQRKTLGKKIALVLSLCALIAWGILGTGASLAWFKDTTPDINNIFHFADFDLVVSHQLTDGKWEEIDEKTKLFDENALYEPGYVQVVYLRVENQGTVPFRFHTAVNVNGCNTATNVNHFFCQTYLTIVIYTNLSNNKTRISVTDNFISNRFWNFCIMVKYHSKCSTTLSGTT